MTQHIELPILIDGVRELLPHRYPFLLVDRVVTVTHVHPSDIHSGIDQGSGVVVSLGRRTEGRDDLGMSHAVSLSSPEVQGAPRSGLGPLFVW